MEHPGQSQRAWINREPRPVFIAGPTAVGKSELALQLAARLGGEIVSVDSMQVYRGLDLGTAKPTAAEHARVPHHLVDVAGLDERFDAARFVRLALAAATEIQSRGHPPVFCGGTGLYFQALLGGLGDAPPADARLRAELEATPLAQLLAELAQRDPETFATVDRQNPRRVMRALEVIRLTGCKFSSQRAAWPATAEMKSIADRFICLTRPTDELQVRIHDRVDRMFDAGLVAETRQLLECGLAQNPTALQALGYRQVVEHFQGVRGLNETIELVKVRTRQFAKRQLTWFRKYAADAQWIELRAETDLAGLAESLAANWLR